MKLQTLCPEPLPSGADLTEEVFIEAGAARLLPEVTARLLGERIFCVGDPDTLQAASASIDLVAAFGERLTLHTLPPHPKCSVGLIDELAPAVGECDGLLAIGSGTVNDLVKCLARRFEKPCAVLGTAASMNGYTSTIAALMDGDLKVTLPAVAPRAVVLDLDILCAAPAAMAPAGLADLLSKPVSTADWWIGSQLGEAGYNALPGLIVEHAVNRAIAHAANLPRRDPDALKALSEALVLSGTSMAVAGSSSPSSGGEHLLSHLWDMERIAARRELNLHGAQVGVAVCLTAALYRFLIELESPAFASPLSWEDEERRIRADHGALAESVLRESAKKQAGWPQRRETLKREWPRLRDHLDSMEIPTPARVREILIQSGAPHTLAGLGLTRDDARRALLIARDIRSRHTVLDLAYETGFFPGGVDAVLTASGVCG
ncbi:MAG: iron-containing alcohol dehydrogenase [bacterium]|nr:iron-containing alcohol dehydrogenase [bacterium]